MNNAERQHSPTSTEDDGKSAIEQQLARANVDNDPVAANQRLFTGPRNLVIALMCVAYTVFHLLVMNVYPLETWVYRLSHVGGGLALGFLIFSAVDIKADGAVARSPLSRLILAGAAVGVLLGFAMFAVILASSLSSGAPSGPDWAMDLFGLPLFLGTLLAMIHCWKFPDERKHSVAFGDILLVLATIAAIGYIIIFARPLQLRAGMPY